MRAAERRGFTLIELLIVIAIMTTLGGTVAPLWYKMERTMRTVRENNRFYEEGRRVAARMADDLRMADGWIEDEDALLALSFTGMRAVPLVVRYRIEDGELIRISGNAGNGAAQQEWKIADLDGVTLEVEREDGGDRVRIEWRQPAGERPMQRREKRLVAIHPAPGEPE